MRPDFKVYGYKKRAPNIIELEYVSLCFADVAQIRGLAAFLERCANSIESQKEWDHEHYFGLSERNKTNISVALLDSET